MLSLGTVESIAAERGSPNDTDRLKESWPPSFEAQLKAEGFSRCTQGARIPSGEFREGPG
jgi:hypothetical protein